MTSDYSIRKEALTEFVYRNIRLMDGVTKNSIRKMIEEFERLYDSELENLYAFYKFAMENNLEDDLILSTIIHDLNGIHKVDPFFSPRSEGYAKQVN